MHRRGRGPAPFVTFFAARALLFVLERLPETVLYALAGALGGLFYGVSRKRRELALANARLALGPSVGPERLEEVARESFRSFFRLAADVVVLPRYLRPGEARWRDRIRFEDTGPLEAIRRSGRGALFLTAHFGSWEVLGASMALLGFQLHSIARPLRNAYLDEFLVRRRGILGQRVFPRRGGIRQIATLLRGGRSAALVCDQNARRKGLFVPFFGRLASTDRSPAVLARRLGVPVVVGSGVRKGRGFRFRCAVEEVLRAERTGDADGDDRRFLRRLNEVLERAILRHPEQYLWLHDRYHTRPPEERTSATVDPCRAEPAAVGCGGAKSRA